MTLYNLLEPIAIIAILDYSRCAKSPDFEPLSNNAFNYIFEIQPPKSGDFGERGVISSLLPAWDITIGNLSFNISPSIAVGKGVGFGANVSATFRKGDFAISGGFGLMNYGAQLRKVS